MSTSWLHYLPLASTVVAAAFAIVLAQHVRRKPNARYLHWWLIGVIAYGAGTFVESWTTLAGWQPGVFRAWYIAGALLGGAPLAQGTVYLLLRRRTADILSAILLAVVAVASVCVLLTPLDYALVETHRLSGAVMEWQWVRLFSPFVNAYAFAFLVGGAAWSAWVYYEQGQEARSRALGNALIAVGALLPGIGGASARAGHVEVLYVTELVGLLLIWWGYTVIVRDRSASIHAAQRVAPALT